MFITRSKVVKTEEDWVSGPTVHDGDNFAGCIDITEGGRNHVGIRAYGRDKQTANELRDFVLRAVEAYRGV